MVRFINVSNSSIRLVYYEDADSRNCLRHKFTSGFLECCYWPVGGSLHVSDGNNFKEYFVCFLISISSLQQNLTTNATITDKEELLWMNSFGSISKKLTETRVLGLHNLKAFRKDKDSYMQIFTTTIFDFSMDNIKVVELLSETEGT